MPETFRVPDLPESTHIYITVKLRVPEDIRGDREAIEDWVNQLEYDFQDLSQDPADDDDPCYPGRVESEIVDL